MPILGKGSMRCDHHLKICTTNCDTRISSHIKGHKHNCDKFKPKCQTVKVARSLIFLTPSTPLIFNLYDMSTDKEWMKLKNQSTSQYLQGVNKFLEFAFSVAFPNENIQMEKRTIRGPCNSCLNVYFKTRRDVHYDLLKNGILQSYTIWDKHGEHMDNFHANNEAEVNENLDYEDMLDMLQVASC
ncbi:hypothetical protein Cgig2_010931 [Carnegiea gigantea]|uniref:Transposase-associated domain-containing protein n=1 Tax=Carnegiea gigantea TaxID=171969 RepID=A0A9Q1K679_9CARY|nr:hypothetical protein Cgig2_010931 [Carnegiea gigantea]